jgi:hypothetical protein
MSPHNTEQLKQAAAAVGGWRVEAQPGKTPKQARQQVKSTRKKDIADREVLDNPQDVRPVEPQCRKCGQTFSTEAELVEHAKTCEGGNAPEVQPHFH